MNRYMKLLAAGVITSVALLGCKSSHESAGDQFLKAGDLANAVMQYDEALKEGNVSSDFYLNYTKANIAVLRARADADPSADFLDVLQDTISSLLKQHPSPENEADFANVLYEVGDKRLKMGSPEAIEGAFRFFKTAEALPGKPAEIGSKIEAAKNSYVTAKLKDIESDLAEAASEPSSGIVADYKMNELLLTEGQVTPDMAALWSKIRKQNLSTYLMYDLEGLIDQVDARINKYGILLGIVKYTPGPKTMIQVKAWNGTSGPLEFDGGDFSLVDRKGTAYKSINNLGVFKKKSVVGKGEESKTGGLTFALPAGSEPDYLELQVGQRTTRKYLP